MINKRLINTGVEAAPAAFDPLQNFETVTYTGNGGTQKITGYIRKGAAFNGSSSIIDFSQPLLINTFSVSFWINTTSTATRQRILGNPYGGAGDYGWNIRIEATTGHLAVEWSADGTNAIILDTATSVTDGNWHHIVATWEQDSQKIYIDKVEKASSTNPSDQYATTDTFKIGANWNNTEHYNGKIDQVRIFDKAISSSEVTTLYNETYDSSTKSTTDIFGDGSGVALYELDEDANDTGVPIDSGQSAVFNGSSSYIEINNFIDGSDSNFTLSFWVNSTDTTNAIYSSGFTTSNEKLLIAGGIVRSYNGSWNDSGSITAALDGSWHHLAISVSSNSATIYIDGVSTTSLTLHSLSDNNLSDTIGARWTSSPSTTRGAFFNGSIDQVRIYSSALSASDVEALVSETNVPTANLVAHYKLDGNANDETTNYNGTWGGTEAYSDPAEFPVYNGTPTNVNFLGMAFQPDLVWIKDRSVAEWHGLMDSVRGSSKVLYSNATNAEVSGSDVTSFDSNGFSLTNNNNYTNRNGDSYVAWCWKAGGVPTPNNNTQGTITSTVSANPDAGFSIVKYNIPVSTSGTVGHGLSTTPQLIITKSLDVSQDWSVNTSIIDGSWDYAVLNKTDQFNNSSLTLPTSNVFSAIAGGSTSDYIAYCFHSVDGYQKVGSFQGTGTTTGNIVTTGFRPRFLMWKASSTTGNWQIVDSIRSPLADKRNQLYADLSQGEDVTSYDIVDFNDDSFQMKQQYTNAAGVTYIYLAIA